METQPTPKRFFGHDVRSLSQERTGERVGASKKWVRLPKAPLTRRQRIIGVGVLVAALAITIGGPQLIAPRLVEVPASGGTLREGVVGVARFINPVLAVSAPDKDLTSLVHAGLMTVTTEGLRPELAKTYEISEDGTTYTFLLKENLTFHDGVPVTAEDVVFTIGLIQTQTLKSPQYANWADIAVSMPNQYTIVFTLPEAYNSFLENTTVGILPRHIWQDVPVDEFPFMEANINAIGAGPYRLDKVTRTETGTPTTFALRAFSNYALGMPHVRNIVMTTFRDEVAVLEAYKRRDIDALSSMTPSLLGGVVRDDSTIHTTPLPRIFGVFFNQNRAPLFARHEVRAALQALTDTDALIHTLFQGYAHALNGPFPPGIIARKEDNAGTSLETTPDSPGAKAEAVLTKAGWKRSDDDGVFTREGKNETLRFTFTLSTVAGTELSSVAAYLAQEWRVAGIDVTVEEHELSDFTANVIRPRRFDALLFGQVVGRELDLYSFWHSSQRNDPGLNITQYANIAADKYLQNARESLNPEERSAAYRGFAKEVATDIPALFLYSPDLIYITPNTVRGITLANVTEAHERFASVHQWFIETKRIWGGWSETQSKQPK